MLKFCVLCTNRQNGGQCEVVVEANSAEDAAQQIEATRPGYMIKSIWAKPVKVLLRSIQANGTAIVTIANDDMRLSAEEMQRWCQTMNAHLASTGADKKGALYYLA